MSALNCPGYNRDVASGAVWDFASETTANDTQASAQKKANAKAMADALMHFALHQCPRHAYPFQLFASVNAKHGCSRRGPKPISR